MCVCVCVFFNKTSYKKEKIRRVCSAADPQTQSVSERRSQKSALSEEEHSNDIIHLQIYSKTNVLHSLEDLRGGFIFFKFYLSIFFILPSKTLNATHATAIESTNATGFF